MATPSDADTDIVAKLLACGAICIPQGRPEWRGSRLDEQQREYILDRESALRAAETIARIPWQNIDCANKQLALQIRDNTLHSLAVLLDSMRRNEDAMI